MAANPTKNTVIWRYFDQKSSVTTGYPALRLDAVDNLKKNKARVIFPACKTPTSPDICAYQILSDYLKQYGSSGLHKISTSGEISIKKKK